MIHALPGLGADHRLFPAPWDSLPQFVAHDWPRHRGETTLAQVALSVCRVYGIEDGDTVVGASLGGMVAGEIAKIRKLEALYLVGSATCKDELNRFLAVFHPLAGLAPIEWLRLSARKIPSEAAQMFASAETSFIRHMCRAIFHWEGFGSVPIRCSRIHGRRDRIIPAPKQVDLLLDGGHLISMTHAAACAEFIKSTLSRLDDSDGR